MTTSFITTAPEAIAAVIKKLGECIPELVAQGQPVKIDGLGIFYGTAENKKNGLTKAQLLDVKVNPLDVLAGIHLRFQPQGDSLNLEVVPEDAGSACD